MLAKPPVHVICLSDVEEVLIRLGDENVDDAGIDRGDDCSLDVEWIVNVIVEDGGLEVGVGSLRSVQRDHIENPALEFGPLMRLRYQIPNQVRDEFCVAVVHNDGL